MKEDELLFITENQSKFREVQQILYEEGKIIVKKKKLEILEPKLKSLEETSLYKAKEAFKILKLPLITDDTGIIFEEFKNFPGPYSRLFYEMVGFKGIMNVLRGCNRNAYYRSVITYTDDGKEFKQFEGCYHGKIAMEVSKMIDEYFPYDAIFIPNDINKIRSEVSKNLQIKNSHRRKALKKFISFKKKYYS
jgi:non-canonical purine NTP pyrophosphatase (RdgB/HAM1 family)